MKRIQVPKVRFLGHVDDVILLDNLTHGVESFCSDTQEIPCFLWKLNSSQLSYILCL
jgi:hypothetical protein